jgi:hypothetical protein
MFQSLLKLGGLALVALILAACDSATSEDKEALLKVQQKWGDKYDFKLTSDPYWTARAKPTRILNEEELRAALSLFGRRTNARPSAFVYLNVYDMSGKFAFQLYQNPDGEILKETKSEHY